MQLNEVFDNATNARAVFVLCYPLELREEVRVQWRQALMRNVVWKQCASRGASPE